MRFSVNKIAIFLFSFLAYSCAQNTTLEHVTIFFRHGNRGPFIVYPTNPNTAEYWISRYNGLAELTARGTKQMYDLGAYIKSYYGSQIPEDFNHKKVYVRSTGIERALRSALAFMAGLYKPNQNQKWTTDPGIYDWFPIPVHSAPIEEDPLYNFNSDFECPKYKSFRNKFLESKEYLDVEAANSEFVKNMSKLSGITDLDFYKLWIISDDYYNEIAEGLAVPNWVTENLERIIAAKNYAYYTDFGTVEKARFFGGTLLNEINNNLKNKASGALNYTLSVYSNHDYHLVGLISLLNFTWPLVEIPYYSALSFELRKDSNNKYYTQILLRNGSYGDPLPNSVVQIQGCDKLCPLEKYLELTSSKTISNYKKECELEPTKPEEKESLIEILWRFFMNLLMFWE